MGGEDRDLRFGMRRVLRDELLAQDDEEADRGLLQYVHHVALRMQETWGRLGGCLGGGKARVVEGCACERGANRISYTASLRDYSLRRNRRCASGKAMGCPEELPFPRGESGSGSRPWLRRFRGFN